MPGRFDRTELLIGRDGLAKLKRCRVALFGLGGVGSYVLEGLARAGVGAFHLVDFDVVDITNINRQLHALNTTLGRSKVELMADRVRQINPEAEVVPIRERYVPGDGHRLIPEKLDYLVDAIDEVPAKVDLIERCYKAGIPLISSMGAGNKLNPEKFHISDISKTSVCPLARVVRRRLKEKGIEKGVKVVFSTEIPIRSVKEGLEEGSETADRRGAPGSISFVPPVAGLFIAGEVVRDLLHGTRGD